MERGRGRGRQRERERERDERYYIYCYGTHRVLLREFWNDAVSFVSMDRIRLP